MSRVYIDLRTLLFGVLRVWISLSTHRSHSPRADDAVDRVVAYAEVGRSGSASV